MASWRKKKLPPFYLNYEPSPGRASVFDGKLMAVVLGIRDDLNYGPDGALIYLPLRDRSGKLVGEGDYRGPVALVDGPGEGKLTLTLDPGSAHPATYYLSSEFTQAQEDYLRGFVRGYAGKRVATGREAAFDSPDYGDGYRAGRDQR
jgi:hypothetical protein